MSDYEDLLKELGEDSSSPNETVDPASVSNSADSPPPAAAPAPDERPAWLQGLDSLRSSVRGGLGLSTDREAELSDTKRLTGDFEVPNDFKVRLPGAGPSVADTASVAQQLESGAAGGVHGLSMGADRSIPRAIENSDLPPDVVKRAAAALRGWSEESERKAPNAFHGADTVASVLQPANKVLAGAKFGMTGGRAIAGNILANTVTGGAQGFSRAYGDTGDVDKAFDASKTDAMLSGAGSLLGAGAVGYGTKRAAALREPGAMADREALRVNALLKSSGLSDAEIDAIKAKPEVLRQTVEEAERLLAQHGPQPVNKMGRLAGEVVDQVRAKKEAAAAALTEAGATANPQDVADQLMSVAESRYPGHVEGVPTSTRKYNEMKSVADEYSGMPKELVQDEYLPVEAKAVPPPPPPRKPSAVPPPLPSKSPASAAPPSGAGAMPPDPVGALSELEAADIDRADPYSAVEKLAALDEARNPLPPEPGVTQLSDADLTEARPSAHYQPPPPPRGDVPSARYQPPPPAEVPPPAPKVSARAAPRINVPVPDQPDAIDALASQGRANVPPPDDIGALMEHDIISQKVASGELDPAVLAEFEYQHGMERGDIGGPPLPRPSARYQPPGPPTLEQGPLQKPVSARYQEPPIGEELGPLQKPASARYTPPAPTPRAPAQPPPPPPPRAAAPVPPGMEAPPPPDMLPPAAAPRPAAPPPLPPRQPPEQIVQGTVGDPTYSVGGTAGVPFDHMYHDARAIGRPIGVNSVPSVRNEYLRDEYAAVDHAMDIGAENASPSLAADWSVNKAREHAAGLLADAGQRTANQAPPKLFNMQDNKLGYILGGIGGVAGSLVGTPALGGAAGMAGGYWLGQHIQPRANAYRAQWLSKDTAAMMDRVASYGRLPVASTVTSVHDSIRPSTGSIPGMPTGITLGRDVKAAMQADPSSFMPWADDYSKDKTDDDRAATTERLYRTDKRFAEDVFPLIISNGGR